MNEINIKDLFAYIRTKISFILLMIFLSMVLGTVFMLFFQVPKYKSYTTILLTKTNNDNETITQTDIALNKNLVTTYSEIIKSKKILSIVIKDLELNIKPDELYKKVNVTSVKDTEIIKIEVTDRDKEIAKLITNDIADVFSNEIVELYNIQNIGIIDKAETSSVPYNINPIKEEIIFIFIGLALSLGIVFIRYYFDSSVQSIEDIENIIGLPVIGTIPLRKPKKVKKQ